MAGESAKRSAGPPGTAGTSPRAKRGRKCLDVVIRSLTSDFGADRSILRPSGGALKVLLARIGCLGKSLLMGAKLSSASANKPSANNGPRTYS